MSSPRSVRKYDRPKARPPRSDIMCPKLRFSPFVMLLVLLASSSTDWCSDMTSDTFCFSAEIADMVVVKIDKISGDSWELEIQ